MTIHRLLERQLRRHLGDEVVINELPEPWQRFVAAVGDSYAQADRDRQMIEHSLELMSEELNERNWALRQELAERQLAEEVLQGEKQQQAELIGQLKEAQNQLLQSEKMASIGQLAAGVAHEINNPIGYVSSNLGTLQEYVDALFAVLACYEENDAVLERAGVAEEVARVKRRVELAYLKEDLPALLRESREGVERVRQIVQDLKDFSRAGQEEQWARADLHKGLDSTLNVVWNEVKYKAEVVKEYGDIPLLECLPSQLNQVFMNLLVNAAQAIETSGTIVVRTRREDEEVWVEVQDSGSGIDPEHVTRLFDPFFTTKPVGKGTGLGLSVSYSIVKKHGGSIEVESTPGMGALFRVRLPLVRSTASGA